MGNVVVHSTFAAFLTFMTTFGIVILKAVVAGIVGWQIIKRILRWLKTSKKLDHLDKGLRSFLVSFSRIALYAVLLIVLSSIIGIPATSFVTVLASCGVAIGLALQGALSNFAGGLMILFFKPFRIGDYVEVGGESGTVVEISVVYTVLLTVDNKRVTLPNGTITNSVIENYSAEDLRRVDLNFSAAYGCDMEKVKGIISSVVEAHPLALTDPAPFVRLSAHDASALTYTARVWVKSADYWTVNFDLLEGVKKAFDENGIEIPFQQVDVRVRND